MRGCRGSSVEASVYKSQSAGRIGKSGRTAKEWGKFGKGVGVIMREYFTKGYCSKCKFFGVKVLSPESQKDFDSCWGIGAYADLIKNADKRCTLTPELFHENCPQIVEKVLSDIDRYRGTTLII